MPIEAKGLQRLIEHCLEEEISVERSSNPNFDDCWVIGVEGVSVTLRLLTNGRDWAGYSEIGRTIKWFDRSNGLPGILEQFDRYLSAVYSEYKSTRWEKLSIGTSEHWMEENGDGLFDGQW